MVTFEIGLQGGAGASSVSDRCRHYASTDERDTLRASRRLSRPARRQLDFNWSVSSVAIAYSPILLAGTADGGCMSAAGQLSAKRVGDRELFLRSTWLRSSATTLGAAALSDWNWPRSGKSFRSGYAFA